MEEKRFREWIDIKSNLHYNAKGPRIKENEIWWCSFGENIGIEINGKSSRFTRPVIIFRKLSNAGFLGIPLTTQEKTGSWYVKFDFLDKVEYAALCQARVMSISRLHTKIGELSRSDQIIIRNAFRHLYG